MKVQMGPAPEGTGDLGALKNWPAGHPRQAPAAGRRMRQRLLPDAPEVNTGRV
jgi:hypothetical protein